MEKEIAPFHADWEEQGYVAREVWNKAGENGFLCMTHARGVRRLRGRQAVLGDPDGGAGTRRASRGIGFGLHSEIVAPYILHYGTPEQKAKYLPEAGQRRDGWRHCHERAGCRLGPAGHQVHRHPASPTAATCSTAARPSSPMAGMPTWWWWWPRPTRQPAAKAPACCWWSAACPAFSVGKRLKKLGMKAQDTSELFFDNVRVPADNLLGGAAYENKGFICLMEQLPWERLQIAISAVAAAQAAIDWTVDYVKERKVFGQPVAAFQNTALSRWPSCKREVQVARVFVDKCCELICNDAAGHGHRQHGQVLVPPTCSAR